jgi:hypothetical protein
MCENGTVRPLETVLRKGREEDKAERWRGDSNYFILEALL